MKHPGGTAQPTEVGAGRFRYRSVPDWGKLPPGYAFVDLVGVATDSRDRVFVFDRGEHPVVIFDRDGRFVGSWGERQFVRPHGPAPLQARRAKADGSD